jgi:hypothetical protein
VEGGFAETDSTSQPEGRQPRVRAALGERAVAERLPSARAAGDEAE